MPLAKSFLLALAERFPQPATLGNLIEVATSRLAGKIVIGENDINGLKDLAMHLLLDGMLNVHVEPKLEHVASSNPMAFPPARLMAGQAAKQVTNQRHETIALNPLELCLLAIMDGQANTEALREEIVRRTEKKEFSMKKDNVDITDIAQIRQTAEQMVKESLAKFGRLSLLM